MRKEPDDLDELINAPARPGAKQCRPGWYLENSDHPDIARLRAAMDGGGPHSAVAAAFIRRGMEVSPQSVSRHRQRGTAEGCRCPR